ncbi:MAG: alanine racemase, partial [Lentisphaeria bacterium]|nr:alanine racemase [Lentisphaeria bacterium]
RCTDIFSHFPVGYKIDHPMTREQLRLFRYVLDAVAERHIMIPNVHFANSDAIGCLHESVRTPYNCARAGISLYGFSPDPKLASSLEPVVSCYSHVIAVRRLPKGHNVGYECTYTLPEDTDIALISAGYADGLPLQLSNQAEILIRGYRCPVLGRVCMDYMMVSLAPLGGELPDQGEIVTLIGSDMGETVSPEEWAKLKGTHVYDILCSFGGRMERRYVAR